MGTKDSNTKFIIRNVEFYNDRMIEDYKLKIIIENYENTNSWKLTSPNVKLSMD
jgi:hypothetical protein